MLRLAPGPFGAYGEFVRSRGGVRQGGVTGDIDHDAWQIVGSWVSTGEAAPPERNVRQRVNFNFERSVFDGTTRAVRVPENTLALRAQLGF